MKTENFWQEFPDRFILSSPEIEYDLWEQQIRAML